MPYNNNVSSATATSAASQSAGTGDIATDATIGKQVAECKNRAHAEILQDLMDLYRESSRKHFQTKDVFRAWCEYRYSLDKHDMLHLFNSLKETHLELKAICNEAREANPDLKMFKSVWNRKKREFFDVEVNSYEDHSGEWESTDDVISDDEASAKEEDPADKEESIDEEAD
ncbi:hypothetical protein PSEUBRA_002030 [Kalmanozyma brasiliensis GHG001]|uniref:uncharacterized protein n=1 Tax=Kalmanozyma brasiliensis (strain GHG001) TaxID=1365824 RepID=UPI001CE74295|nr:uncharacterized protein PSEUBRA_002030 [Kalmanozyma brasiliensis GHG001]KAF6767031.1 hypothetical protein PSEUBRA_002030 [Kalmanozyma brasiliensis GHG001]